MKRRLRAMEGGKRRSAGKRHSVSLGKCHARHPSPAAGTTNTLTAYVTIWSISLFSLPPGSSPSFLSAGRKWEQRAWPTLTFSVFPGFAEAGRRECTHTILATAPAGDQQTSTSWHSRAVHPSYTVGVGWGWKRISIESDLNIIFYYILIWIWI
jgi:hypothetical protein